MVGQADGPYFAGANKLVERAKRLFQRCDRAGEMRVENIDVVGLQAAQTGLDDAGDDAARQALFRRFCKPGPRRAYLCRYHNAVAAVL